MKKLNNTELTALASKIYKESKQTLSEDTIKKVKEKVNSTWDKFLKSNDYKVLRKYKYNPAFYSIIQEFKIDGYTFDTNSRQDSIRIETNGGTVYGKILNKETSFESIKNELIAAQIEATDLESLISKVKESLKLT